MRCATSPRTAKRCVASTAAHRTTGWVASWSASRYAASNPVSIDQERPDESTLLECTRVLQAIVEDRSLLVALDEDQRRDLLTAAGRVSRPERTEQRRLAKAQRRLKRDKKRDADERLLDQTGIRALRREVIYPTPPLLPGPEGTTPPKTGWSGDGPQLQGERTCYVCKASFKQLHHFYDQLCPPCAEENYERRNRTADLRGRVALITGARVKIGYHAAIKLLRAGAEVWVTTRFPRDAARRFSEEVDYADWSGRLSIYGLDLRHTPSVERFCTHLLETADRLDYIVNNACQTVRRPPGFYSHLMDEERAAIGERARPLLAAAEAWANPVASAELSQVPLLPSESRADLTLFPAGELDADQQQVDHREMNSWRLTLDEVPAVELLEVHLVNAVAPFLLNGRLRPLMKRTAERDKHIVNVSAMEGQFYRSFKTDKHPHTNMAKAALNMMTRTSAIDYVEDGIHMNSVDTGWITDEDPITIAARKVEEHGFHPPLDIVDGAARIIDPIFDGVLTGEHQYGLFLKDYRPIPW